MKNRKVMTRQYYSWVLCAGTSEMDIFNYEPQSPVILTRPYSKPQPCDKINANVNAELYDAIMKNHLL